MTEAESQLGGRAAIGSAGLTSPGSSAAPFSAGFQHTGLFYVYYLARDCTGLYPWCVEIPRKLVPVGETIKVIQRNYVNPDPRSASGPDPTKLLNPVTIVLDGHKRPATH